MPAACELTPWHSPVGGADGGGEGHTGGVTNPRPWRGRCRSGSSNTGGPPLPQRRAPFTKKTFFRYYPWISQGLYIFSWIFLVHLSDLEPLSNLPDKLLSPFLCTAPLPYVPQILFTPATIDCLINNKTKIALQIETVILNYICGGLMSHGLSN